jgi:hypothetical protein
MLLRVCAIVIAMLALSACASTQLTYSTVDVAGSVESVYSRQILANLSKFIDEPHAIPSQIDISSGIIQTTVSVAPSVSAPMSSSVTRNALGAVTQAVTSGSGLTVGASDAWQQNWNVTPISDANTLRNLQALYRYVIYGLEEEEFRKEYHVPRVTNAKGEITEDPYMLLKPHCVLCGSRHEINKERLKKNRLYWTGNGATGTANMPPSDVDLLSLGHYGSHDLFISRDAFNRGHLSNFILFVLPNAEPGSGARSGAGSIRNNAAPSPNQIIP